MGADVFRIKGRRRLEGAVEILFSGLRRCRGKRSRREVLYRVGVDAEEVIGYLTGFDVGQMTSPGRRDGRMSKRWETIALFYFDFSHAIVFDSKKRPVLDTPTGLFSL